MGISTNINKKVIVKDNDNIEINNLNRQFLFRKKRIGPENEHIFDVQFWDEQTCIINAVDNIEEENI